MQDTRNLVDKYKGRSVESVVEDLDCSRAKMHIAIENWEHDFNIGSIVRTANAFNVGAVHIVGRRKWNRRGAMMTDVYQHVYHHYTLDEFSAYCQGDADLRAQLRTRSLRDTDTEPHPGELAPLEGKFPLLGIDILPGVSTPLERAELPERCIMLFGSEGTGLSDEALDLVRASSRQILHITQYGSTRSINAGHAAAVAMYAWALKWRV